jgi:hypothetical protein
LTSDYVELGELVVVFVRTQMFHRQTGSSPCCNSIDRPPAAVAFALRSLIDRGSAALGWGRGYRQAAALELGMGYRLAAAPVLGMDYRLAAVLGWGMDYRQAAVPVLGMDYRLAAALE